MKKNMYFLKISVAEYSTAKYQAKRDKPLFLPFQSVDMHHINDSFSALCDAKHIKTEKAENVSSAFYIKIAKRIGEPVQANAN